MRVLRSTLFNLLLVVWTAIIPMALVPILLLPRGAVAKAIRIWAGGFEVLTSRLLGLDYVVRGRENLPAGPCVIAANHQSAWETLMMFRIVRDPSFILKRELAWAPFGWFPLRAGGIAVDRKGHAKALRRTLARAGRAIAAGQPVVIFPQGTRTAPGVRRAFQPGVAALYRHLRVPVVPMALNSGSFWGRRSFLKRPGTVIVELLPPIEPGMDRRPFMALLQETIDTAVQRLTAEAERDHSET